MQFDLRAISEARRSTVCPFSMCTVYGGIDIRLKLNREFIHNGVP